MIRSSTNMRNERDIKCMKILFMFTHVNAHNSRTTYDAARCRHERAFRTRISRAVECQGFCTLISRLSHQVKCTAPRAHMCRSLVALCLQDATGPSQMGERRRKTLNNSAPDMERLEPWMQPCEST